VSPYCNQIRFWVSKIEAEASAGLSHATSKTQLPQSDIPSELETPYKSLLDCFPGVESSEDVLDGIASRAPLSILKKHDENENTAILGAKGLLLLDQNRPNPADALTAKRKGHRKELSQSEAIGEKMNEEDLATGPVPGAETTKRTDSVQVRKPQRKSSDGVALSKLPALHSVQQSRTSQQQASEEADDRLSDAHSFAHPKSFKSEMHRSSSLNGSHKPSSHYSFGSLYSGHAHGFSHQESWVNPDDGLGFSPALVNQEAYYQGFAGTDLDSELAFGSHDKLSDDFVGECANISSTRKRSGSVFPGKFSQSPPAVAIKFGLKLVSRTPYNRLDPGMGEQPLHSPVSSVPRFLGRPVH
jgi:hypothetical protein